MIDVRLSGHRARLATLALLLTGLLLVGLAPQHVEARERTGRRGQMLDLTNEDRQAHARRELGFAARLSRYAKDHSRAMARKGHLFHSTDTQLRDALQGYDWSIGGENVGVGSTLQSLENAFMGSKLHRENILREGFDRAAFGIVREGDTLWVTVIFYG